jgi:hypothetical protein
VAGRPQPIDSTTVPAEWLAFFTPGDLVVPALAFLQAKISERLLGKVTQRLLFDVEEKRLHLRPVPDDLITALWLQFAQAVDGDKAFRQCTECEAYFEVSPEVARTNRRFCTNACRSRMYRQRQTRAKEMHAAGMPIKEIADRLDSDVATVRAWLGNTGRGKGRK